MSISTRGAIMVLTVALAIGGWGFRTNSALDSKSKQLSELQSRIEEIERVQAQHVQSRSKYPPRPSPEPIAVRRDERASSFDEAEDNEREIERPESTPSDPAERDSAEAPANERYLGELDRLVDSTSNSDNSDWHPDRVLMSEPAFNGAVDQVRCGNNICRLRVKPSANLEAKRDPFENPIFTGLSVDTLFDYDSDPQHVVIYVARSDQGFPKI